MMHDLWRRAAAQLVEAGIEESEARLEAEVLLRHVLGMDRAAFWAHPNAPVSPETAQRFSALLARRLQREPLAYILGSRAFYGLDILVDRRVLIPRPETEGLVERAMRWLTTEDTERESQGQVRVVDVGTGSGCIAVALAVHVPTVRIVATDASAGALAVAQENARRHGVADRIQLVQGDLLQAVASIGMPEGGQPSAASVPSPVGTPTCFDLIISNPPYIAHADLAALAPEIRLWEPLAALDGGSDGLDVIRRLIVQAPTYLRPGGAVMVEIGDGQGEAAAALGRAAFPLAQVRVERDLAGRERYLIVETRGQKTQVHADEHK